MSEMVARMGNPRRPNTSQKTTGLPFQTGAAASIIFKRSAIFGVSEPAALGSIRIGLGKSNTLEHVEMFIDDAKRMVAKLREISAA